jgi:uncharacterized 2Fe-2S/4Fe-4S cluster protein (DUF4445 family)
MSDHLEITLLPEGGKIKVKAYRTLQESLAEHLPVRVDCGGRGICGKCKVIVETADAPPEFTDAEKDHLPPNLITSGYRLSCQVIVDRPVTVQLPVFGQDQGHVEVKKVFPGPYPTYPAVKQSPGKRSLGLAVDLGTTTIAAYLCDKVTGHILSSSATVNPQHRFGEDVIIRINMAGRSTSSLKKLQTLAIEAIAYLANDCLNQVKGYHEDIDELLVAGNTTMEHILAGIDPSCLGRAPFEPAVRSEISLNAKDLGLDFKPGTQIVLLPVIAGFAGGDTVACLLADQPHLRDETTLIVDLGTNGELVLGNKESLWSTSCATGPALEGAQLSSGMRASNGAIRACTIDPGSFRFSYSTIDNTEAQPPLGFCGSGVLDIVAQLRMAEIISRRGNFEKAMPGMVTGQNGNFSKLVLIPREQNPARVEISVTQNDIRQIQLAKAALATGIQYLMKKAGINKIDRTILTGAFGNAFNWRSAVAIGMLPAHEVLGVVISRDNLAGEGAVVALLDRNRRSDAESISAQTRYMNLAEEPDFMTKFVENMQFP